MFKRLALISVALSLTTVSLSSLASSALIFDKNSPATVAVNLDWKYREGTVVIHPRHTRMVSNVNSTKYRPLIWKSRYGSVIFHAGNRFKSGPATSGMNEKGLTATVVLLKTSRYATQDKLPVLNAEEWVQYVLDKFQSVQEVIDDSANYQIVHSVYRKVPTKFHMILSDAGGKSAILEYLEGRVVVHTQEYLAPPVLTNTDYLSSLSLLTKYLDFGGARTNLPGGYDSRARFIRAAHYIKRLPSFVANEEHIAYAFNGLGDIAQAPGTATPTQLSMVFDIASKTIYFRSINDAALRVIPLGGIEFKDLYEPLSINAYQHFFGDVVSKFKPMNG
jgi:choloylglycine hydrolase